MRAILRGFSTIAIIVGALLPSASLNAQDPVPPSDAASAVFYPRTTSESEQLAELSAILYPNYRRARASERQLAGQHLCRTEVVTGTPSVVWNAAMLQVIRDAKPAPPVVARIAALAHTAMYDAWAPYTPFALTTMSLDKTRRPVPEHTEANKRTSMYFAAHVALTDLFPAYRCVFDDVLVQGGYLTATLATTNTSSPEGVGIFAARKLMTDRHLDGSNQLNRYADTSSYVPVNAPMVLTATFSISDVNRWQPLFTPSGSSQGGACDPFGPAQLQRHVVPHFGHVKPFALNNGVVITPTRGPAWIPSAEFDEQAFELLQISRDLNDLEKSIAEYWADGPSSELPPGHWTLVAMFVSRRDANTLDEDAKMFFAMTNATLDAGILAWRIKRMYDNSRPISAMRWRFRNVNIRAWGGPGQGTRTIPGTSWLPFQQLCFVSPPFAEFPSGHSTFSAAASEVLKNFTGSDFFGASIVITAGSSLAEPDFSPQSNITLTWPTFTSAADQAGISRRYGGIHFREADLQARVMGREVGRRAWMHASFYFSNTVTFSNSVLLPYVGTITTTVPFTGAIE